MVGSNHGPRLSMIILLLRGTRNQGKISTPGFVSRAAVGGLLEQLGVVHSIERVVMAAAPLLMMMRLRIIGLSQGRERALIEAQMLIAWMMSRILRRRHL